MGLLFSLVLFYQRGTPVKIFVKMRILTSSFQRGVSQVLKVLSPTAKVDDLVSLYTEGFMPEIDYLDHVEYKK